MLRKIDTNDNVKRVPHEKEFLAWKKKISSSDYKKIVDEINDRYDEVDILPSGWIPGHSWDGTVYEPIYNACDKNEKAAAMFFGLIVFETLMNRPDKTWGFDRFEINGVKGKSMTYYLLHNV